MEKIIYQDEKGLYYVGHDQAGNPIKVYCDENGVALQDVEEGSSLEIFQQEDGTYYYVAHNELGEAYKVLCDENGNELTESSSIKSAPYVAPVGQVHTSQIPKTGVPPVGAGVVGGTAASATVAAPGYQAPVSTENKQKGLKGAVIGVLVAIPLLFGGYYAYSTFLAKPTVNMGGYVVDVKFSGKDGEGKAAAKITSIPDVKISDSSKQNIVDDLLTNAEISYSENSGLKNGDKIAVNIDIDPREAESAGIKVEGNFKKTFTVDGLSEASSESKSSKESSSGDSAKKEAAAPAPAPQSLEYKQVYNTGYKGLLMRTGPSQSYPAVMTLFDGTPVRVLEYNGSWAKVNYNGAQGWMYTGYLR